MAQYNSYIPVSYTHLDVYKRQFRKGEILFQTEDHSLVNSLVKLGKITHEEVAHHPQRLSLIHI